MHGPIAYCPVHYFDICRGYFCNILLKKAKQWTTSLKKDSINTIDGWEREGFHFPRR